MYCVEWIKPILMGQRNRRPYNDYARNLTMYIASDRKLVGVPKTYLIVPIEDYMKYGEHEDNSLFNSKISKSQNISQYFPSPRSSIIPC